VDRHPFEADPDPDRLSILMPIQIRIGINKKNADPHADPIPSFTQAGKLGKIFFL
jgi:hypothetical protein